MSDTQSPAPLPTPTTPPAPAATPTAALPPKDERTMAMLCHLLGAVLPSFGFLAPLIIWLVKKDTMPFVDDQGREALNFQITVLIAFVACAIATTVTCGFGSILFLPVWVASLVLGIMGALQANEGVAYRYPFTLRLIK